METYFSYMALLSLSTSLSHHPPSFSRILSCTEPLAVPSEILQFWASVPRIVSLHGFCAQAHSPLSQLPHPYASQLGKLLQLLPEYAKMLHSP